jgi:hypothetical protein
LPGPCAEKGGLFIENFTKRRTQDQKSIKKNIFLGGQKGGWKLKRRACPQIGGHLATIR